MTLTPEDMRDATWEQIRGQAHGEREFLWHALARLGPMTTRALAQAVGLEVLRVRPRVTELVQLGLVEMSGESRGREGVYRALSEAEAREAFEAAHRPRPAEQLVMAL